MADKKLLQVRSNVKKRKPTFKRVQSNQFAKLKNKGASWRKPKGMGNKVRRQRRGQAAMPKVGYGSPKAVRGLNKDGFREVVVSNVLELKGVDTKTEIAIIGQTVGGRKKLEILNEAKKLNVMIGNIKDFDKEVKALTKEKKVEKKKSTETKKVEAKKTSTTTKKTTGGKKE